MSNRIFVPGLRNSLLNETLLWLGIVSLPALAMALAGLPQIGWHPALGLYVAMIAAIWISWIRRFQTPYHWRVAAILLGLSVTGLGGFVQLGPAAISGQFLILFLLIAALFLEGKAVFRLTLAIVACLIGIAWANVQGVLTTHIDYESYLRDPTVWGLLIFSIAGYGGAIAALAWRLLDKLTTHERLLAEANVHLEQQGREITQLNRLKSDILSNLGHEFRTPMNGIIGMAELLKLSELDQQQRHWLDLHNEAASELGRMIERMLDFVALEDGSVRLRKSAFNLPEVIDSMLAAEKKKAQARGLRLIRFGDSMPVEIVLGDPQRLMQILRELLTNAFNFTQAGTVAVGVRQSARVAEKGAVWIAITVEDTGKGIPADHFESIFQPLTQVDSGRTRSVGGNGLGLAIVKRIVSMMGGTLEMSSTLGQGSRFCIEIPFDLMPNSGEDI